MEYKFTAFKFMFPSDFKEIKLSLLPWFVTITMLLKWFWRIPWLHFLAGLTDISYFLDVTGHVGPIPCSSISTQNILSRPSWALGSLLLISDGLKDMRITTASSFRRIPSPTHRHSRKSKYYTHTGVWRLSASHPSNTNFITDCRLASREVSLFAYLIKSVAWNITKHTDIHDFERSLLGHFHCRLGGLYSIYQQWVIQYP